MIAPCKCKHKAQDELHGVGMRVHTESAKYGQRCTVCGPPQAKMARIASHAKQYQQMGK